MIASFFEDSKLSILPVLQPIDIDSDELVAAIVAIGSMARCDRANTLESRFGKILSDRSRSVDPKEYVDVKQYNCNFLEYFKLILTLN